MTVHRITWDEAISPLNVAVAHHTLRTASAVYLKNKTPEGKISDTANSQYLLALYYSEVVDDKDKANEILSRVIKMDPQNIYPYILKGDLLIKKGEIPDSNNYYHQALDKSKNNSQKSLILGKLGYSNFLLKDYEKAAKFFQQALIIDNKKAELNNNVGCCKVLLGDTKGGIGFFDEALKINPNNIDIQLNKGYADILQYGAKRLLDFTINSVAQYSEPGIKNHVLGVVIDLYLKKNPEKSLNNQFFGLSYFLIGDVEKGLTFFENKLDLQVVPINNDIKKRVFDSIIFFLLNDQPDSYQPFFFLLILNICGPAFVIDQIESAQDPTVEKPSVFHNLLIFAKYVENPKSESVMSALEGYYQTVPTCFNYGKNKDPIFHKLFEDSSIWEVQGDEKLRQIKQDFIKICTEHSESGRKGSIFDPVVTIYQNILDNNPDCLRVKEKLADVYLMMGSQKRDLALVLFKEILLLDPSNEHARVEVQKMSLQPCRISDDRKDQTINKKNKGKKR